MTQPPDSSLYVQSLARGLSVLRAFDAQHPRLTLSQAAARADVSRASARRLLHTLVELGYAGTDGTLFTLTPRVLSLGWAYLSGQDFPQLAEHVLEKLSAQLGESASAAQLDGTDVVYVQRVQTRRIMRVDIKVGTRFPAAWTSMGRVLLAHLPEGEQESLLVASLPLAPPSATATTVPELLDLLDSVRKDGHCLVDQELEPGLRSVAVPVRDPDGAVKYALNVSLSTATGEDAQQAGERVLPGLLAAASELESAQRMR